MNLKELSAALGLSQTTVSRALNGYPEVSEATRKRVREFAKAHNYRPNLRAKQLATGRTMAIGHVIPTSGKHEIVNPIFADFISGAGEVYSENGYDLLLSVVRDDEQEQTYRDLAQRGAVDGVVIHAPEQNDPRIAYLEDIGVPFAVHGRAGQQSPDYCWVDVDNYGAIRLATEHLLDLGHTRIALLNGIETIDFAQQRRRAFCDALEARGLRPDPDIMFAGEMTEYEGYRNARACLDHPNPPTAIIASSIIMTIGVRRLVQTRGLSLGTDVSLVTYDDDLSYLRNGIEQPIYTAVKSSVREAGSILAQNLLKTIQDQSAPRPNHLLSAELIIGQTTGPCVTS